MNIAQATTSRSTESRKQRKQRRRDGLGTRRSHQGYISDAVIVALPVALVVIAVVAVIHWQIRLPRRRGLLFDDSPPDQKPDELPVVLATFQHLIGWPSRDYLSIDPVFLDQEIGGSPDVAIGDHSASRSSAIDLGPALVGNPNKGSSMADVTIPVWITVATPLLSMIIGWALKSISDAVDYRRNRERDKETREHQKRQMLFERRISFQRETLLDLQETVMQLGRNVGAMHHKDLMAYKTTNSWQSELYPTDLDTAYSATLMRISVLVERVRDKNVRLATNECKLSAHATLSAKNPDESKALFQNLIAVHQSLNSRVGDNLRKLDEDELSEHAA